MSPPLIGILAVGVLVALGMAFAIFSVAQRADEHDRELSLLKTLGSLRSPSGKPFFAGRESVKDFVDTLDDAHDEPSRRR